MRSVSDNHIMNDESIRTIWKWLIDLIKIRKSLIAIVFFITVFSIIIGLTQPLITKEIIDQGVLKKDIDVIKGLGLLMVSIALISFVSSGISKYVFSKVTNEILLDFRIKIYGLLADTPSYIYSKRSQGDIYSRIQGDTNTVQRFVVDSGIVVFNSFLTIVISISIISVFDVVLLYVVLAAMVINIFVILVFKDSIFRKSKDCKELGADLTDKVIEYIGSIKEIRRYNTKSKEEDILYENSKNLNKASLSFLITSYLSIGIPTLINGIIIALVFIYGGVKVAEGDGFTLGELIAFITYFQKIISPVNSISNVYSSYVKTKVSMHRLADLIDDYERSKSKGVSLNNYSGSDVLIDNVSCQTRDNKNILKNISTLIRKGERIKISGPSGSGKSSFANLFLNDMPVNCGYVSMGDYPIQDFCPKIIFEKVKVANNSSVIFNRTLYQNVTYGNEDVDPKHFHKVLKICQLQDIFDEKGMDYKIEGKGSNLSEGQKQRIIIARSLMKIPDILILDEILSGVDESCAHNILQDICDSFKESTVIFISHQSDFIVKGMREIFINNGEILFSKKVFPYENSEASLC
ncbi:MAG: ABC transporter ATP-binding protein [Neptuniibacter sp.]